MSNEEEIEKQIDEIVELLEENGIAAAAEYFPDGTEMPYAAVLTTSSQIECSDMGAYKEIFAENVTFRIELFTLSRSDPARKKFKTLIINKIPVDKFTIEEQSFGQNYGYMTAIEFELMV